MNLYKPRCRAHLSVPVFTNDVRTPDRFIEMQPPIVSARWTRSNHLEADALTLTFGQGESLLDPRLIKSARVSFWLWDAQRGPLDPKDHLRFTGIAVKAERSLSEDAGHVEMTFHDYTSMFLAMKPIPSAGIPTYSDTIESAWQRICDNTGWYDVEKGKIISSVAALRDNLVADPIILGRQIGEIVPERFRKIAAPTPKQEGTAWDAWQYCVGSLGLVTYIDRDECIIATTTEHFEQTDPVLFSWGKNIATINEKASPAYSQKGVMLHSFDPQTQRVIEAFYPPIGDPRIKAARAAARHARGGGPTENNTSQDYEPFAYFSICDQRLLKERARAAYEERGRQEVEGTITTYEMRGVTAQSKREIDLLDLRAGDAIQITHDAAASIVEGIEGADAKVRYLVDELGYDEPAARLAVESFAAASGKLAPVYHVKSIDVELTPDAFRVDVRYHNLIRPA